MKYVSYFIFFAFLAALLLFLKNALQPQVEPLQLTGSGKCGECHGLKNEGNQYDIWKNSRHSAAYSSLLSEKAKDFSARFNLVPPEENALCLKCHTTEHFVTGVEKSGFFNISEGVGCEVCHGAGSRYTPAEIMKDENLFMHNGGLKGDEKTCEPCHSSEGNKDQKLSEEVCPFQENDFDYKSAFEKIKHPVNKDKQ
jgi:Cytochrome c554 and c-prime